MSLLPYWLLLLIPSLLFAAEPQKAPAEAIVAQALTGSRAWDHLSYLTDNIGPRLSGSKQAEAAVEWSAKQFESWGLEVRREPVMVPKWVRGAEEAKLVSHFDQQIVLTTLGGSVATPDEGLTAEVVVVGSFDELQAAGEKVRGKIVLFNVPMDQALIDEGNAFRAYSSAVAYRGSGPSRAAALGATAALIRSVASASLRTPHTGMLRYDPEQPKIPAAAVSTEDADLLERLSDKGERVRMHLRLTPRTYDDVPSANVVAELPGSERPDEIVLIGGHIDSWDVGTGAVDNGSGVAMVMETMRLLKQLGLRPKRTVRAVLFMNEENGLRGGRGYFEAHRDEIEKHYAVIESDAGAAAPAGFRTTLSEEESARLLPLLAPLATIGVDRFLTMGGVGADTSLLTKEGVPGFGPLQDSRKYFDWHHSPADTLDKVNREELDRNVAAIALLTWELANREEPLK